MAQRIGSACAVGVGDTTRLRQVALNLVVNAVKFTAQGCVTLTLVATGDEVQVLVHDTGLGISLAEQDVIFEEFRQSARTAGHGYRGLGLGLAISKRLVELHGGKIGVTSSGAQGSGATFFFTLPRIAAPPALADTQNSTVLLLTDLDQPASDVQTYLAHQGFRVETFQVDRWVKSVAPIATLLPSAVVLNAPLAIARGWEILHILKRNPATLNIPVLFYSLESGSEIGSLLELNSLTKPIEPEELRQALTRQGLMAASTIPKTILLVDDEPNILELHVRLVQELATEHQVLQARNGREALAILRERRVDLVLLDLMMPEVDGFTVLETMRANPATRDVPLIVLTAQVLTEADMARLNQGVTSVLSKGLFSASETLVHLKAILQRMPRPGMEAQRIVRKAMAYIQTHAAEPLSRPDIAVYVGVSESYLTHCFQQELHLPPMTYLTRYRINQAKTLLTTSTLTLAEIAEQVGFSSEVYFHRVFRRKVGVPPGAYRQGRRPG